MREAKKYLSGELVVFALGLGVHGVPPLSEDLAHGAVVLVGVPLVDEGAVALGEDEEGVHRPARVFQLVLWATSNQPAVQGVVWCSGARRYMRGTQINLSSRSHCLLNIAQQASTFYLFILHE